MVARNALILVAGVIQEMPAGDSLNGTSAVQEVIKSFTGTLTNTTGVPRWYPDRSVTLQGVYFSLGVASSGVVTVNVKKNGVSIFTGALPTCAAGAFLSTTVPVTTALAVTDYLTVDVTAPDGGFLTAVITYA